MNHEVKLYGPIGGMFGIDAESFLAQIPKEATEIKVRIHSPGGSVGDGLAIYHALKDHPATVIAIVDGYAASAASFVMLAGDEVRVHRNSIIMVHNPWTIAEGNSDDLRKTADTLDVHRDAILDIYRQKTGKTEEELREMMDGETYFRGVEAQSLGFADTVLDNYEEEQAVAALLKFERAVAQIHMEKNAMSKTKTRKEIAATLEDAQAQITQYDEQVNSLTVTIESMKSDHAAEVEGIQAQHSQEVEALNAEVQGKAEEIEAHNRTIIEINDQLTAARAALADAEARATVASDASAEQLKEIEQLKAKLQNPAFIDAASVGREPITEDGEGEGSLMTKEQAMKAYAAITDPAEQKAFREQHAEVLGIKK